MTATHPSICRFCHANCGILVDVEEGRAVRVKGDRENPAYHGFTCAKGRSLPDQLAHPDRLLVSRKRTRDGDYVPIASERAMDEIAARIQRIVDAHGPRSVALYPGTYSGPHPASIPAGVGW
ncbi:MAG: molybdopterin dinucleotide-binding protein, partial [Myxococcota bacterium]